MVIKRLLFDKEKNNISKNLIIKIINNNMPTLLIIIDYLNNAT